MGKSITPKYRIELKDGGLFRGFAFFVNREGKPSEANAKKFRDRMNESLKKGGSNYHITKYLGYYKPYTDARIVNQKTKEVVAEFKAPMFEEI